MKETGDRRQKKYVRITLAITLCATLFTWFAMEFFFPPPEKPRQVVSQTAEFELSKDFSVIKVINIIDTLNAVDAFGGKLKVNEWYVRSNITKVVFRVDQKSMNYTDLGRLMVHGEKTLMRIKTNKYEEACVHAQILLLGEKILTLDELRQYQLISIE